MLTQNRQPRLFTLDQSLRRLLKHRREGVESHGELLAALIELQTSADQLVERFREHHFEKRFELNPRARPLAALDTVQCDHGPFVEPKNAAQTRAEFSVGSKSEGGVTF